MAFLSINNTSYFPFSIFQIIVRRIHLNMFLIFSDFFEWTHQWLKKYNFESSIRGTDSTYFLPRISKTGTVVVCPFLILRLAEVFIPDFETRSVNACAWLERQDVWTRDREGLGKMDKNGRTIFSGSRSDFEILQNIPLAPANWSPQQKRWNKNRLVSNLPITAEQLNE